MELGQLMVLTWNRVTRQLLRLTPIFTPPLTQIYRTDTYITGRQKYPEQEQTDAQGFHFFCDDATQTNRGNSYFVWFRVDQSVVNFISYGQHVFIKSSVPMTITANTWYDSKFLMIAFQEK